jgi:hypothetical protein
VRRDLAGVKTKAMLLLRLICMGSRLRQAIPIALCTAALLHSAARDSTSIRIDSVEDKYAIQDFSFEVSPETGHVGIRLEYTYPVARLGSDDSDRGPSPRIVTVPGLEYDAAARAVIFEGGATRTICATATDHKVLFWKTEHMKPTGACIVSTRLSRHEVSDGWSVNRFRTLDAFFELRGN